jgi:DNA-binding transcriptional LysR family regulator
MLDARRLATLDAVLRSGSFAAAALELGYTQSAVSQHITELERATGQRLLERRPVRATPAGRIAQRAARAAGTAIAAAETELRALRTGEAGSLRLAAFASAVPALAAPALGEFARSHPAVDVTLVQLETPAAYDGLVAGRLDLAITFDYDLDPSPAPEVILRAPIAEDPLLLALPADHRLATAATVRLADLAGDPWIAAPLAGLPLGVLRDARGVGFEPRLRFEGEDFRAVLALVASGLGIALLPQLAARDVPAGVALRPIAGTSLSRHLYTARLRTDATRPVVAALEAAIRDRQG